MFIAQQLHGGVADEAEVVASEEAIGHPSRTFDAFVADLVG